jgi:HlyD family secretion protein
MRRTLITLIILASLAVGGIWSYQRFFAPEEEPEIEWEEAVIGRGTLEAMVNATGTILPERQTTLSFQTPGRVADVFVEEGQAVTANRVLASLETTELAYAVTQAEVGLALAQAQLLSIQRSPAQYELAAAQAAVDSAKAAYRKLLAGPTDEEIKVARTNLDQAKATMNQAQQAYDRVADRPDVALQPEALQLEQATVAYEAAKANYELTMRPASQAERAAAQSSIRQAESTLLRLQEGVAEEDLLIAQLQVEQAQISLEQARLQLDGTTLAAPHEGAVTLVGVKPGELSGGQPAFIVTDLSQFHIDVTVDEIDIARVAVGQAVTVTLDALPGDILTGRVTEIAQTPEVDSGVVTYNVRVDLDPTDVPLRVGMTANIDIVTERREGVLLVPNRFVRVERTTGQAFVDRLAENEIQLIEIQIGLRDDVDSEVLAGLEEGDAVVLVEESSREQLRRLFHSGGP